MPSTQWWSTTQAAVVSQAGMTTLTASLRILETVKDCVQDAHCCLPQAWSTLSGRAVPHITLARAEFEADLRQEADLTPLHVEIIAQQLLPQGNKGGLTEILGTAVRRFLRLLRPWYCLWYEFTAYVARWCAAHEIAAIVFLGRDALPFYFLAKGMASLHGTPLVQMYMNRSMSGANTPLVMGAEPRSLFEKSIAYVDSGCYGTLLKRLVDSFHDRGASKPAAFFLYSRNPHIFGYLNYVIFSKYELAPDVTHEAFAGMDHESETPMDVAAMAFDTLEAMPKPYVIRDSTAGLVEVKGLLSFELAVSLYCDLYFFARRIELEGGWPALHKRNSLHLRRLWNTYHRGLQDGRNPGSLFWIPPTPKWEGGEGWLKGWDLGTLLPQNEAFGLLAG